MRGMCRAFCFFIESRDTGLFSQMLNYMDFPLASISAACSLKERPSNSAIALYSRVGRPEEAIEVVRRYCLELRLSTTYNEDELHIRTGAFTDGYMEAFNELRPSYNWALLRP